jgi:uncharacterized membrane protein YdcZ (DUF606 family)
MHQQWQNCASMHYHSTAFQAARSRFHLKKDTMNPIKLIGLVLIVAGILGLVYGGFSYTKDTTALKIGSLELSVQEKKSVNIPLWAGIGAIVFGGILLGAGGKGR